MKNKSTLKLSPAASCGVALLALVALGLFLRCAEPDSRQKQENGTLLFHSGFEPDSKVVPGRPGSYHDAITGIDKSVAPPNDWSTDISEKDMLGKFSLQYEGSDSMWRSARIIPEPGNPANHVLRFWANIQNVEEIGKTRIQANIYGADRGLKELYQSVRIFLPGDMEAVKTFPDAIHWLTIMEVWNNITWSLKVPYGFRITVGMGKPSAEARDLYFMVDAEDCLLDGTLARNGDPRQKYVKIWRDMNLNIPIPVGKWMTLDYYIKEGNADTGRFWMAVTPDGGQKQVVFDIKGFTHGTTDPAPDGITHWNPMKLYTSKALTRHVLDQGKALQLYYDDFAIWEGRTPEE